jgi:hypothetical protein
MQVVPAGPPPQERPILPEKPSMPVALKLYFADWPALTVTEAAEPKEKSDAVPLSGTVKSAWFGTLVFTLRPPAVAPPAVGVNVTLAWQFPPAAIVVHPLIAEKPAVGTTPLTCMGMVPTLLKVTVCAALVPPSS